MKPQHAPFDHFYDDRVGAHRQLHPRETTADRWTGPSVLFSVLALLVTFVVRFYGADLTLEGVASSLGNGTWDLLVLCTPTFLLIAVDSRINPPLAPGLMREPPTTHAAKSELMRRVMGLDRNGGGMMATVFRARTRALSSTGSVLGFKAGSDRPPGLGNRDNSCYQNSVLQGLASLPSFHDYLSTCIRSFDMEGEKDISHTLQALLGNLNDTSNNGKTLWTPRLLKSMSTWTQQDAQEYYSKILDDIDKGVGNAVKGLRHRQGFEGESFKDDGAVSEHSDDSGYQSVSSSARLSDPKPKRNPLEGLLAQRVACVQCGYSEGLSMIPFNCLTLSLGLDKNRHDLYERLDSYSKVEEIEGVECHKCTLLKAKLLLTRLVEKLDEAGSSEEQLFEPRRRLGAVELALEEDDFTDKTITEECKIPPQSKVSSTKTKQIVIARPPQSLAVHMNRSVFDPSTFNMMKNSAPVDFPLTLDLGPWCLGSGDESGSSSQAGRSASPEDAEELWQTDPTVSMVAGDLSPSRLTGPIYELKAAVTHYGRHENGHYICYRRYSSEPKNEGSVVPEAGTTEFNEKSESAVDGMDNSTEYAQPEAGSDETEADATVNADGDVAWWRLSDHNVTQVDEETVLSLSPGVFMLFYECVDPTMVRQTEVDGMEDALETADLEMSSASESEASETAKDDMLEENEMAGFGSPTENPTISADDGKPKEKMDESASDSM